MEKPKIILWKQWLVISMFIWPLSIVVPMLINMWLPMPIDLYKQIIWRGACAFTVVGILVFMILPNVMPRLDGWLRRI